MTTMQVIGAVAMMVSGSMVGLQCWMGALSRYGWEHRPRWRLAPMAVAAGILFTCGLTAVRGVQPLTPWGETVAITFAVWWVIEVVVKIVAGWRRSAVAAVTAGAIAPVPAYEPSDLRRLAP